MPSTPSTPDVAEFVARLLKATRQNTLAWEPGEAENVLAADLGHDYSARIAEVQDFDNESHESDHILTLYERDQPVFSVDRRTLGGAELTAALDERVEFSYAVFSELWRRALLKSRRVTDHLEKVNKLLSDRIVTDDDVPF